MIALSAGKNVVDLMEALRRPWAGGGHGIDEAFGRQGERQDARARPGEDAPADRGQGPAKETAKKPAPKPASAGRRKADRSGAVQNEGPPNRKDRRRERRRIVIIDPQPMPAPEVAIPRQRAPAAQAGLRRFLGRRWAVQGPKRSQDVIQLHDRAAFKLAQRGSVLAPRGRAALAAPRRAAKGFASRAGLWLEERGQPAYACAP